MHEYWSSDFSTHIKMWWPLCNPSDWQVEAEDHVASWWQHRILWQAEGDRGCYDLLASYKWVSSEFSEQPCLENNGGRHSWPTSSFQMFTHPPPTQTHAEYAYYTYPFTLIEIKFEKRNLWFRAWGFRLVMPMLAVQPLVDPNLPWLCFPHLEIGYFSCYKCAES